MRGHPVRCDHIRYVPASLNYFIFFATRFQTLHKIMNLLNILQVGNVAVVWLLCVLHKSLGAVWIKAVLALRFLLNVLLLLNGRLSIKVWASHLLHICFRSHIELLDRWLNLFHRNLAVKCLVLIDFFRAVLSVAQRQFVAIVPIWFRSLYLHKLLIADLLSRELTRSSGYELEILGGWWVDIANFSSHSLCHTTNIVVVWQVSDVIRQKLVVRSVQILQGAISIPVSLVDHVS